MAEVPALCGCHGDDGGPRMHPCRHVQEALREATIPYEKVIAGQGSPFPFLCKASRDVVKEATGTEKLPTLKLPDGTVLSHSRAILCRVREQNGAPARCAAAVLSMNSPRPAGGRRLRDGRLVGGCPRGRASTIVLPS